MATAFEWIHKFYEVRYPIVKARGLCPIMNLRLAQWLAQPLEWRL